MTITLVCGPMFSGKTNKLIELCTQDNIKKIIIKFKRDNRYTDEKKLISNDGKILQSSEIIEIVYVNILSELNNLDLYEKIIIDEGQFFDDLCRFCIENKNKEIIIAGLDFDFKQEWFKPIYDVIPLCDNIIKLEGKCMRCDKLGSKHSIRTIKNDDLILIGSSDIYIAVCDNCL